MTRHFSKILLFCSFLGSCANLPHKVKYSGKRNAEKASEITIGTEVASDTIFSDTSFTQINLIAPKTDHYQNAYNFLSKMIDGDSSDYNFKRAVFEVENAFSDGKLSYLEFDNGISAMLDICKAVEQTYDTGFDYSFKDRDFVLKHSAIFKTLTDTLIISQESANVLLHFPYKYNYEDFNGATNWTSNFVSQLLLDGEGNCKSFSYLYKILSDEYNVQTSFALAPNHIYIKHACEETGMYNTELTNATFPVDAWIMSSGYIHLDAIRSGIYMKPLSEKEALALCLIDLAQGFKKKMGASANADFLLQCSNKALDVFENYINALLLKSEILSEQLKKQPDDSELRNEHELLIVKIYSLGYRKMPDEMYQSWLQKSFN